MSRLRRVSLAGLVALMAGSSYIHFRKPEVYTPIVPKMLGNAEFWVFWSGVAELLAAILLLVPATRKFGAKFTAVLLVVVFPANIQMALDGAVPGGGFFAGSELMLWLRLPLQPVLIYWAWTFARDRDTDLTGPKPTR